MCKRLVMDTNSSHLVLDDRPNKSRDAELRNWISRGNMTLCYTNYGKLGQETRNTISYHELLRSKKESGDALLFEREQIRKAMKQIDTNLRSNDRDLLALCIASKTEIVVTRDNKLKLDLDRILQNLQIYPVDQSLHERKKFLSNHRCN